MAEISRRSFIQGAAGFVASPILLPFAQTKPHKPLRFAVIADVHHGLAPDATKRLAKFVHEVKKRDLDLVIQMGDFCHPGIESTGFLELWNEIPFPKLHVLGNHDMDRGTKDEIMKLWAMKSRYGSYELGGYRFIVLDLNHYKKNGELHPYANGNYFTDNATYNWADPEQLAWLGGQLATTASPTIVLSHQPLGFAGKGQPLPPEQVEVLDVLGTSPSLLLCGHMHVDRLEHHRGLPCYCVNSASYFWHGGMNAYTRPLFSFMEISDGMLKIEGVAGEFVKPPPAGSDGVVGRSASIAGRNVRLVGY